MPANTSGRNITATSIAAARTRSSTQTARAAHIAAAPTARPMNTGTGVAPSAAGMARVSVGRVRGLAGEQLRRDGIDGADEGLGDLDADQRQQCRRRQRAEDRAHDGADIGAQQRREHRQCDQRQHAHNRDGGHVPVVRTSRPRS